MRIFIINLKRSEDRRQRMISALSRIGVDYEFFEGVDGYKLTDEEIKSYIDPTNKYPRSFKKGEVGCFLSHYYLIKKIADENIQHALILEDDVEISPRLPELLKELEIQIKQGEVVHLYSSFPLLCKLYSAQPIDENYRFVKPLDGELVVGNVAYIITASVAKIMANALMPMCNVIDDWKFWKDQGYVEDFKIVFPHPIDLSDNYSDIHESYGGGILRIKKILIKNRVPILSDLILQKRKKNRWQERRKNILIDNLHPTRLFY